MDGGMRKEGRQTEMHTGSLEKRQRGVSGEGQHKHVWCDYVTIVP